jgi:DNA transformation protein
MANSPSFVQHVKDLFAALGEVTARSMFGGHGLYCDGLMFGLLDDGELFLKTDEVCEQAFLKGGGKRWVYPSPKGPMETRYLQPPTVAMEDPEAMREWFVLALGAARRKQAAKMAKRPGTRRAKPRKRVTR